MKRTAFFVVIIIMASCAGGPEEVIDTYNRDDFFVVDYKQILDNPLQVKISDLEADVEYIKLETNENCLLHPRADYHFTDKFIFVDNSKFILQFDRKGNFIKQIGKPGRGPGEIGLIRILSVLDDEQVLVVQTNWARKLYFFSYEGEFLRTEPFTEVHYITALPDNSFLYFDGCAYGHEENMFLLIGNNKDTLDVVPNHYKWENKTGRVMTVGYHLFYHFYFYKNEAYMKSMHNDTVYHARADSITPEYLIDMGNYMLPQEFRPEVPSTGPSFNEKSKDFRFANSFEVAGKLFIASQDYQEEGRFNMIYDRYTGTGNLLIDESNFEGGIINDFDGGIDFWPRGSANDSTLFMPILPHQLITDDLMKKISKSALADPEKKKELLDMIDGLNENDNPILMLVRMKGE